MLMIQVFIRFILVHKILVIDILLSSFIHTLSPFKIIN